MALPPAYSTLHFENHPEIFLSRSGRHSGEVLHTIPQAATCKGHNAGFLAGVTHDEVPEDASMAPLDALDTQVDAVAVLWAYEPHLFKRDVRGSTLWR